MWIMTKTGFISIVQHNQDEDMFCVRARDRRDLELTFPELEPFEIIELATADYRWRANLGREYVMNVVMDALEAVDYTSHAKEAMSEQFPGRHSIYMDVWRDLMKIQTRAKHPAAAPSQDDDFEPMDFMDGDIYCAECGDDLVYADGKWDHIFTLEDDELHEPVPYSGDQPAIPAEEEQPAEVIDFSAALASTKDNMREHDD